MVKIMRPFVLGFAALVSIPAFATVNVNCPAPDNLICLGGKWAVSGGGWSQTNSERCEKTDTVDSFSSAFTLTTYYIAGSNGQKFTSGPFTGDYMPVAAPYCTYSINSAQSATLLYTGAGNSTTASFAAADTNWSYGSNNQGPVYNCLDSTGANCGLTVP